MNPLKIRCKSFWLSNNPFKPLSSRHAQATESTRRTLSSRHICCFTHPAMLFDTPRKSDGPSLFRTPRKSDGPSRVHHPGIRFHTPRKWFHTPRNVVSHAPQIRWAIVVFHTPQIRLAVPQIPCLTTQRASARPRAQNCKFR